MTNGDEFTDLSGPADPGDDVLRQIRDAIYGQRDLILPPKKQASFFDGRVISLPTDPAGFEGLTVGIEAPTLIRVEGFLDNSSTGFLQNIAAAVRVQMRAATKENFQTDATVRRSQYIRGVGPFIWLPYPGLWTILCRTGGNIANRPALATAFVGIDPNLATQYMAGLHPFDYCSGEITLPAGTVVTIPDATLLATFFNFNWFGMTRLRIFNSGGTNPMTVRVGAVAVSPPGPPANGLGFPTTSGATNAPLMDKDWRELAGCNVTAISTVGTTLYFEARSI